MLKLSKYALLLSGALVLLIGIDFMSERWSILDRVILGIGALAAIAALALTEQRVTGK